MNKYLRDPELLSWRIREILWGVPAFFIEGYHYYIKHDYETYEQSAPERHRNYYSAMQHMGWTKRQKAEVIKRMTRPPLRYTEEKS